MESSAPGARPQGASGGGLFAAEDHGEVEESVSARKLVLDLATKGVREAANAIALEQSPH